MTAVTFEGLEKSKTIDQHICSKVLNKKTIRCKTNKHITRTA